MVKIPKNDRLYFIPITMKVPVRPPPDGKLISKKTGIFLMYLHIQLVNLE